MTKDKLNHRERIETILAGEKPDRYAASFWRHYFELEHDADGTVAAMLDFQNRYDWDLVKINPRADYHVQDWGLKLDYSTNWLAKHAKLTFPINQPDDWNRIEPLPLDSPSLAEHLEVIRRLRKELGHDTPLLMTVFTPLSLAGRIMPDRELLTDSLRNDWSRIEPALEAITDTFTRYVTELRNAGADGIFYATCQWATSDRLTFEEYERFALPYDLRVIEASGEDAINILHVCEGNNYLRELAPYDYLSAIYNWDTENKTNPTLDEARELLDFRTLMGGFPYNQHLLELSNDSAVLKMNELKERFGPTELIFAPGCAIPPNTPESLLKTIRSQL